MKIKKETLNLYSVSIYVDALLMVNANIVIPAISMDMIYIIAT